MVEEIALPANAGGMCSEVFPAGDDTTHLFLRREGRNEMNVVGHREE